MKRFTWIRKDNEVYQFDNAYEVKKEDTSHGIVMDNLTGVVIVNKGNPITWPTDATDGLQAIVDVKAGTLRFGMNNSPVSRDEFVVSEYVEPFVSVEDIAAVHVLDLINEWPTDGYRITPPGFSWRHHDGGVWSICGMNGDNEFFEGHWLNYHENKKKYSTTPSRPVTKEEVMALVDVWPHDDNIPVNKDVTDNWIWSRKGHKNVIINLVDNVNSGVVITENDWRNYLSEELRKYPPIESVTAASMLTAALGHMEDRAKTYDAPGGERSMGKTVAAFNTITGLQLSEEQGWLFMEILKQVRSQQGNYRADNYEDMVAYAALRGECAARERGSKS